MTQRVLDQIGDLIQRVRAHGLGSDFVESSFARLESHFAEDYPKLYEMQTQSYGTGFEEGKKEQKGKGRITTTKLKDDVIDLVKDWEVDGPVRQDKINKVRNLPVDD